MTVNDDVFTQRAASLSEVDARASRDPEQALLTVLNDAEVSGAILVGAVGSGRRTALHQAIAGLESEPIVVHLYGSPYAAKMPRGVLAYYLSQLDTDDATERLDYVRLMAEHLREQGRRTVVVLGNPEQIDSESAIILAQLAAMKVLTLVVVCMHMSEVPADLLVLYRSGQLVEVTRPSMTLRESRTYLELQLGGPISLYGAALLWKLSQSNRPIMTLLAKEFVAQGKLRNVGGCWVLGTAEFEMPASIRIRDAHMLNQLDEEDYRLLLVLALSRPIPESDLVRHGMGKSVANLRNRGIISVDETRGGTTSITVPILGHLIRDRVEADEVDELTPLLQELFVDSRMALVAGEFESLVERGDYRSAVEVANACIESGAFASRGWLRDPGFRADMVARLLDVLVDLRNPAAAETTLVRVRNDLGQAIEKNPASIDLAIAEQKLSIVHARLLMRTGRARDVELTDRGWLTETLHFRGLVALAQTYALCGRYDLALDLVNRVKADMDMLSYPDIPSERPHLRESVEIEMGILSVLINAGEWTRAREIAEDLAFGTYPFPTVVARADLIATLLEALAHPERLPIPQCRTLQSQFEVAERTSGYWAVQALIGYGTGGGPSSLPPGGYTQARGDLTAWMASVFTKLQNAETAGREFMQLAKKSIEAGNLILAMGSLALALRHGRVEAAGDLLELAGKVQAPIADAYELLARGVIDGDGNAVAESLESLITHGHGIVAGGENSYLLGILDPRERRRIRTGYRHTGSDEAADTADLGPEDAPNLIEPHWLGQLTRRESEIARQVIAGLTNKAIARLGGVSVRTVEGHLYQVYSKLHVRNRQELMVLYRAGQDST